MMIFILNLLFESPLWIRVAIELLVAILFWRVLGKGILWILSIIPYTIDKIFIIVYRIVELPITFLHKKWGAGLYNVENVMAKFGEKVHSVLKGWFNCWNSNYHFRWRTGIIACIIFWCVIVLPSLLSIQNDVLRTGEKLYIYSENKGLEWLEKHFDISKEEVAVDEIEHVTPKEEDLLISEIELVVLGVKSSLLVRDIPSTEESVTLDRLHNGDRVIWNGDMIFAQVDNGQIETWAKVKTQSGAEGWSRLNYLCPVEYEGKRYYVKEKE